MRQMLCVALLAGVGLSQVRGVRRLEWTDPQGRVPTSYRDWVRGLPAGTDDGRIGMVCSGGLDLSVVDVVVNAGLYPDIAAELAQYSADLVGAGYAVRVDTMRGMSHALLRGHLAGIANLVGAVLVGELPAAWYEDDWGGSAPEEFPIDLYFMDLNGTWGDADGDGLFDSHTGDRTPEIWVGRLDARPLTWDDEVRLVKRYFAKNHLYRTGQLALPDRGLSFVDDDWSGSGAAYLNQVYSNCVVIENRDSTCAANYRRQLEQGYEWIHVMAHSSPWGHTFRTPTQGYTGTVFNSEVWAIRPHAHFYNLFACSGARFTEENYSAGWDVFHDDWGLAAVGSSKTGSMLGFQYFYGPLGRDSCVGDAFKSWFGRYGLSDPDWFYGMTVVGDPTLKPHNNAADSRSPSAARRQPEESVRPVEVVCPHQETDDGPQLLSTADNRLWAIWKSSRNPTNGRFDIFAACRDNGVWSSAYNVGSAYYWETDPCLGLDVNRRPVAVWSVFTDEYHYNLYWSAWNGSSWSTAQEVAEDPSSDMQASMTRDSSGTLWCLYLSRQDLWADIWTTSFNGTSWTAPQNVTRDTATDQRPRAATMPDGTVWVVYSKSVNGEARICARYRSGGNWVETGPVSGSQRRAFCPTIAAGDSGRPVVCWHGFDSGNGEVWYSLWTGSGWIAPQTVGADSGLDVCPALASEPQGMVWLVWTSDRDGGRSTYYAYRSGSVWSRAVRASQAAGHNINPAVAVTPLRTPFAVWQNLAAGNWDIHCDQLAPVGVEERRTPYASRPTPATIVRGALKAAFSSQHSAFRANLLDAAGRAVMTLKPGANDVRSLAPGVYFVRAVGREPSAVSCHKVVVTR